VSYDLIPCACGAVRLDPYSDTMTRNGKIIRFVADGPHKGHHGAGPGAKCTKPASPAPGRGGEGG
jgi:hypothetical protein